MKILMIVPSLSRKWGGTTTSIVNFYKGLSSQSSIECTVLSTVTQEERSEINIEILENNDFILFSTKSSGWRYSKEFINYLKKSISSFDLIWIHALWTSTTYFGARYAQKYNIPYIVTPHGMIEPAALNRKGLKKKLYWTLIEKRIFDKASAIHCITETEASNSKQLSSTDTFVLPNAIAEEPFFEKEYDKLNSICFIGRFHEIKGLDLLLRAFVKIDNLHLLVAGSGEKEYEDYIYSLVKELRLDSRVTFKGFVDKSEKKEMYEQCSFLIVPSHSEVLSLVGLESIMSSTPVLVTKKCNFDDVKEYSAGMIMEDNDPNTIEKYILEMYKSNIGKMSKNAHRLAMMKYSIESVSEKMKKEFEIIINCHDKTMNHDTKECIEKKN